MSSNNSGDVKEKTDDNVFIESDVHRDNYEEHLKSITNEHSVGSGEPLVEISCQSTSSSYIYLFFDSKSLSRLCHWGPYIVLIIILYISSMTFNCLTFFRLRFDADWMNFLIIVELFYCYLILSNYLAACFIGPGYVPLSWKPANAADSQFLDFCHFCKGYKPPRAHHCHLCNRCVLKMDHHCPWINNCVGHLNQGYFIRFLFYAAIACMQSFFLLGSMIWQTIADIIFTSAVVLLPPGMDTIHFTLFFLGVGLSFGVSFSVTVLLLVQCWEVAYNETSIEFCTKTRAMNQREAAGNDLNYQNPYDLGWGENIRQVVTLSGRTRGNGFDWPTKPGFGRFYITIEQMKQKKLQNKRARTGIAKMPYDGTLCPWRAYGFSVAQTAPLMNPFRVPLKPGDQVEINNSNRFWFYGRVVESPGKEINRNTSRRGWFPRASVELNLCRNCQHLSTQERHQPKVSKKTE